MISHLRNLHYFDFIRAESNKKDKIQSAFLIKSWYFKKAYCFWCPGKAAV